MNIDEVMKEFDERCERIDYTEVNEIDGKPYIKLYNCKDEIKSFLRTHLENCEREAYKKGFNCRKNNPPIVVRPESEIRQDERQKCADELEELKYKIDSKDVNMAVKNNWLREFNRKIFNIQAKWRTEK